MWKLSACLLAAPKAVLLCGLVVALVIGGDLWDDRVKAEFWDAVVLYSGTIAGLAFLWMFGPRPVFSWAPLVIGGTLIRMAVSLAAAVWIYSLIHPEKAFFWSVFLLASFGILIAETAVVRQSLASTFTLKRPDAGATPESRAA